MVDLVSISFVTSLGLSPCKKSTHRHVVPVLEGVGGICPQTYGFFHLKLTITDRFNRSFDFIRPFLAVERSPNDSQVLLGRPALKDFKINICNSDDSWEFEFQREPKVTKISSQQFVRELTPKAKIFEVRTVFKPTEDEADDAPWDDDNKEPKDLSNVPKQLRLKYRDFFDRVRERQRSYLLTKQPTTQLN